MPQFSAFKRPSRLVFLDDDTFLLDLIRLELPQHWRADLFADTAACLAYLRVNCVDWQQDVYQQQKLLERAKSSEQRLMNTIPLILTYWRENPSGYGLVQMAIFDYTMPHLTGLDAFEQLQDWAGQRVLLTGYADEGTAVKAFNKGLIDLFIAKQGIHFIEDALTQLSQLLNQQMPSQQILWMRNLSPEQQQWLSEHTVIQALDAWVLQAGWVEYAVTHSPFGLLGVDAKGVVAWLQLEFQSGLAELADMAREQGLDFKSIAKIRRGVELANTDLCLALNDNRTIASAEALYFGCKSSVCESKDQVPDRLLGTLWPLGEDYNFDPEKSYDAWCAKHPSQII